VGIFLSSIVSAAVTIIIIANIIRSLLSFAPLDPYHPIARLLHQFTEPFLQPIRRIMPSTGMFDLSPMIAIVVLSLVSRLLQTILVSLFH
jgi:YggT family protein